MCANEQSKLKQYQQETTLNDEVFRTGNPLMVINGRLDSSKIVKSASLEICSGSNQFVLSSVRQASLHFRGTSF